MNGMDGNKVLDTLVGLLKDKWDYFSDGYIGENEDETAEWLFGHLDNSYHAPRWNTAKDLEHNDNEDFYLTFMEEKDIIDGNEVVYLSPAIVSKYDGGWEFECPNHAEADLRGYEIKDDTQLFGPLPSSINIKK